MERLQELILDQSIHRFGSEPTGGPLDLRDLQVLRVSDGPRAVGRLLEALSWPPTARIAIHTTLRGRDVNDALHRIGRLTKLAGESVNVFNCDSCLHAL